jgi:GNAT superfamily N-acetyltransferase
MGASGELVVQPESGRADRKAFLELPYRLYAGHPQWVPPLRSAEAKTMDPRRNPFFRHAEVQHFLARRGDEVVGRIAAIENRRANEFQGDRTGFFGFFDVADDPEAARALVEAARQWTSQRALFPLVGPVCYSTNEVCGVLVDGFDRRPAVMMPYNRPDYDALLLGAGLVPAKDLLAFELRTDQPYPDRFRRVVDRRLEQGGIRLRPIDTGRMAEEIDRLLAVYNACWERNWGFVPMTEAEFRAGAKDLKTLLHPEMSAVADSHGRAVGFSLVLRDVNEALVGLDGRLFPFGWFRLLRRLPRVTGSRIVALGVIPEMRGRAISEAFFLRAWDGAMATGIRSGECSWVLEDNERMRGSIAAAGGVETKRYRLYRSRESDRREGPRSLDA